MLVSICERNNATCVPHTFHSKARSREQSFALECVCAVCVWMVSETLWQWNSLCVERNTEAGKCRSGGAGERAEQLMLRDSITTWHPQRLISADYIIFNAWGTTKSELTLTFHMRSTLVTQTRLMSFLFALKLCAALGFHKQSTHTHAHTRLRIFYCYCLCRPR